MSTTAVTGTSALQSATAASLNASSSSAASSSSSGGQLNFMQLLMAQMQNQDPSSPTSPTDYVTQMAGFSTIQGITQLNQSISNLVSMQSLTQGVSLIGKNVTYTNASGQSASGSVSSVNMVGGQPQLVINNTNVAISQIQTVQPGTRSASSAAGTNTTNTK
jgi:flagellar basal-body rod modification protein FlgD